MGINLVDGFNVTVAKPLDERTVVADLTARDAIPSGVRYEGLPVYVIAEGKTYKLIGGTTNSDWVEEGSMAGYATEAYADDTALVKALIFG